ncbi:MAG: glyoxylate/hydroxypyruvate reductase A [Alphaproteobacteria bacterium]|nr:glyoxylate/hydroxypyruvate reductase A [Alphaproteobacteria bacterium]
MTTVLFQSDIDRGQWWRDELGRHVPDLDLRVWPEIGDKDDIDYALVWRPEIGLLRSLPKLKAILSLGAGVDHIFRDPDLPPGVPIARIVDPNLTARMTEYVLLYVLRYHRQVPTYEAFQADRIWRMLDQPAAGERPVGIMGLGELGADAGRQLADLGFDVAGWSRTKKDIAGIESFHGADGLETFLARTEILICLLPLTAATEGILGASLFAGLPDGAYLINAARGRHLVEEDLIPALDSGRLAGATLDVFREEPIPADHPFWRHPRITITPHVASISDPRSVAGLVADNIRRVEAGDQPLNLVDPAAGY